MIKQRFLIIIAFVLVSIEIGSDQLGLKSTIASIVLFAIAGLLILWAIYPFMISIWTEIKTWSEAKKTLLVIGIGLFIIFIALNAMTYIKMRGWNSNQIVSQSFLTPKTIESKVQDWLFELGFTISKEQSENAYFHFVASNKLGDVINIAMFKSKDEYLILKVKFILKDSSQETISKLSTKDLDNLLLDIKKSLIYLGLSPTVKTPLKEISYEKILYISMLTKPYFFEAITSFQMGRMLISSYLYKF